jgi:hypothetical protein
MTSGNFRSEEIARLCSFINFGSAISGNWDEYRLIFTGVRVKQKL